MNDHAFALLACIAFPIALALGATIILWAFNRFILNGDL